MKISVINESCIKCGKCARVCPAGVMRQENKGKHIDVKNRESCIACGHCVNVCPTNSVLHSEFPLKKLHPIDYSMLPTPEHSRLLPQSLINFVPESV